MIKYIKDSVQNFNEARKEYDLHGIPFYILEPFNNRINTGTLLKQIEHLVPKHLLNNVEVFYVANIKDFKRKNRAFNAMYKDGAIYISPVQDNEEDLLDDIIHEIAHSFENEYQDYIFGDGLLEREFVGKRKRLYYLVDKPTANLLVYSNPDYDTKFDNHLYHDLDYDYLRTVSAELFYSPYAITSLREYWANGFENYLLGDKYALKDLSPVLYNKLEGVLDTQNFEGNIQK